MLSPVFTALLLLQLCAADCLVFSRPHTSEVDASVIFYKLPAPLEDTGEQDGLFALSVRHQSQSSAVVALRSHISWWYCTDVTLVTETRASLPVNVTASWE